MHTLTISPFLAFLDNTLSNNTQPKTKPMEMMKWSTCKTTTKLQAQDKHIISQKFEAICNICNMGLRVFSPLLIRKEQKGKYRETVIKWIKHKSHNQIWTICTWHSLITKHKQHLFKTIQDNSPLSTYRGYKIKTTTQIETPPKAKRPLGKHTPPEYHIA